jgi:hypothetical protein
VGTFIDMAIHREAPFRENGSGFWDAVIYLSLADEMRRRGVTTALFVTADKDFQNCHSPVHGQETRVMTLDAAIATSCP